MNYLEHIKEDLSMFLYKKLEASEENEYKNISTQEVRELTAAIKNIAEAQYYYCKASECETKKESSV